MAGPETLTGEKSAKAVTIHDQWSLPGIFGGGVKTTEDYTEGNVFLVVPVISTVGRDGLLSGDVLFIEPYSSWGEQGEVAASLGLGWRHYFTTQSVSAVTKHDGHQAGFFEEGAYIGANVFVDMLDTQFDNQFWQLGVGAEVGTRYLEIRGNYYVPLTDKQLAYEQRQKYSYQTTSSSTSQQVTAGAPYAVGNTLAQDLQYTTLTTTTTSTTTIEQLFRLYEEGMEGWDVQASVLVPGLDRWMDVFLIGGYFSFDNQPFGPQTGGSGNVEGWKAGLEVRPVPAVVLNATWYEDERFVGSDWLYGMRLEIPFEMGDLGDGKGFWDRVGAAFTPRRRHLAERLVEPVRRQNTAIKVGNEAEQKTDVSTSVKRVTKVVSQSPQQLVLADDVIFVNNGTATTTGIAEGSTTGTGTAEQPVDTIQAGTDIAVANSVATSRIWNVYTQGGVDYTTGATVPGGGGVRYIGSHMAIPGGTSAYMTGHIPTILGPLGLQAPNGGTYFGVFGYVFNGGTILAENYDQVEIVGNTLNSPVGTGITVKGSTVTTSNVLIQNNVINSAAGDGIKITGEIFTQMQAQVSGNAVHAASGYGINVQTIDDAMLDAQITGNAITDSGLSGLWLRTQNVPGTGIRATVEGNTVSGSGVYGAGIYADAFGLLEVTLHANYFHDNAAYHVRMENGSDAEMDITLTGNLFEDEGISAVGNAPYGSLDVTVEGNTFDNGFIEATDITSMTVTNNALQNTPLWLAALNVHTSNDATVVVQGNAITGADTDSGINLTSHDGTLTATVTGNYISDVTGDAISLYSDGLGSIAATVSGNAALNTATGLSIWVWSGDPAAGITAMVTDNVIQNTTSHGIYAQNGWDGYLNATIAGNHVSGAGGDAVQVTSLGGPSDVLVSGNGIYDSIIRVAAFPSSMLPIMATITVKDNYISNGGIEGHGMATYLVTGNVIENAPETGILFMHDSGSALTISGNYISNAGGAGIDVFKTTDFIPLEATISGNAIVGAAGHGIIVRAESDGVMQATISDNVIQDVGSSGIVVNSNTWVNGITATVVGNNIQAPAVDGIRVEALDNSTMQVTLDGNAMVDAGVNGISLLSRDMANLTATVSNNYISHAGNTGIQARVENTTPGTGMTLTLSGNAILDSANHGVHLYSEGEVLTATLTGNLIQRSFYYGTFLDGANGGSVHATITGNNYLDHTYGFHAFADPEGAHIDATFEGNYFNNGEVWFQRYDDNATLDLTFRQNHFLNSYLTAWSATNLTVEGNLFATSGSSGYSGVLAANQMSNSTNLVKDNAFTGFSWLYIAAYGGGMNVTATGNSFVNTGREGVYMEVSGTDLQANISGNYMSGTVTGVTIVHNGSNPFQLPTVTVADNVIENTTSHGINFLNYGSGVFNLNITGNHLSNIGHHAMNLDAGFSDGVSHVLVSGNAIYGKNIVMRNNPWVWVDTSHGPPSYPGSFTLDGNYLYEVGIIGENMHNVQVTGNLIEQSWDNAVSLTYDQGYGTPATATISGNTIISPSMHAIFVQTKMNNSVGVIIEENVIQEAGWNGIYLNATDMSSITGNIARNQVESWGGDALLVEASDSATVGLTIDGNAFSLAMFNGISLVTESEANITATVSNNYIANINEMGVNVQAGNTSSGTGITVDITGNTISSVGYYAVNFFSQPGEVNATVTGNDISGAYLHSTGGPINATFTGNIIGGAQVESGDGTINATFAQNSFFTAGITALRDNEWSTLNLTVQENYFERGYIQTTNVNNLNVVGNTMIQSWYVWPGGVNVSTTMDSTIVVQNNFLGDSDSINISASGSAAVAATVTGNVIDYTDFDGITLQSSGAANITAAISGNAIGDSQGSGIRIQSDNSAAGSGITLSTLDGNYINRATTNGLVILNSNAGDLTVNNFNGNLITDTVAGSHVVIEQAGLGAVQVQGDVDNTATPSPNPAGQTLNFNGTTPTVNFQLNGALITVPVDVP
ncbi:right-handed parallel beta-helix repeat-containing protein [Roseimicrobium sp. ORNL1]|uniref:right-handed parallel beta-helix repeat-containing protein n=1 Tax=Roseimicrobium sp. ORNL1 TaxID=2711231 RepID=UPI00197D5DC4|nr:right-handed parallel beta-helix repeat-containing protein [Roseimicrobium sp. ORNL1]